MIDVDFLDEAVRRRDETAAETRAHIQRLFADWADEALDLFLAEADRVPGLSPEVRARTVTERLWRALRGIYDDASFTCRAAMLVVGAVVTSVVFNWWTKEALVPRQPQMPANVRNATRSVVDAILSGRLYGSGWTLSGSLEKDQRRTFTDIYRLVAGGFAQGLTNDQIATKLAAYLHNDVLAMRGVRDHRGNIIRPRRVEYASQRDARTLIQHTYQQTLIENTRRNPFVLGFIWHADGPRPCEVCQNRDGRFFPKDDFPLDHPNGMCTFDPVFDDRMHERLEAWLASEPGTYPEIDNFAEWAGVMRGGRDRFV